MRVQEHPPGRERLFQNVGEFLRAGDQGDAARGVGDDDGQALVRVGSRVDGPPHGDHVPVDLFGTEALGEVLQDLALVLRQQRFEGPQLRLVDDGPHSPEHLVVDAEFTQDRVGVVREEQRVGGRGGLLQGRGQLLDRCDVTDLQRPGRGVRRVKPLRGPGIGVVVRDDVDEQEDLTAVIGREYDAAPEVVDADGPHARVARVLHGFQVQPLVRTQFGHGELLELLHCLAHTGFDGPLQDVVALPEAVGERELRHVTSSPPRTDTQ